MNDRQERTGEVAPVRCAVYTRKSTDEGLDQDFNSLDAQREAGEAFIASQKSEGWVCSPERYDDGGYTGANIERPGLAKLLAEIEAGRIDCVVVYKVDRLSRSITDFVKIVEVLDRHQVSFVSVTQQFNTTTSMGRLTLNILLSFAQFEREVIAERIRDKVAAAKRRGKYTGGPPVLGYDVDRAEKRLVVNRDEAKLVRHVFARFLEVGSATALIKELNRQGCRTKAWTTVQGRTREGARWNKGHVYRLLNNPLYIGKVVHRGERFDGEHEAVVPQDLWDRVQAALAENHKVRGNRARAKTPALLKGIIKCGHCGSSMGVTFSRKNGRMYRYYLCVKASKNGYDSCPVKCVSAGEIEAAVLGQLKAVFASPEMVAETFRAARRRWGVEVERLKALKARLTQNLDRLRRETAALIAPRRGGGPRVAGDLRRANDDIERAEKELERASADLAALEASDIDEREVSRALADIDPVWNELFPAEQQRIARLLLDRVVVRSDGLEVGLKADGLRSLVAELGTAPEGAAARTG